MKRILALAATAAICMASAATAATLTVTSIVGTFDNSTSVGGGISGDGTSSISWGNPATNAGQSGYDFEAVATPFVPAANPFDIGTFTHNNFPIFSPFLTSTELTVVVGGDVDGTVFSTYSTYQLFHTETPNATPCGPDSVSICDDIVTLGGAVGVGDAIIVDGEEYFLEISGFVGGVDFLTEENKANSALLQAGFTTEPIIDEVVPLPASVLFLGTGFAVLAGWSRKNKRKNA